MNRNVQRALLVLVALAAGGAPFSAEAQTTVYEDFSGTTTLGSWYSVNGACLTASNLTGSQPNGGTGGQIPGCVTIGSSYYNENLVGGWNGVAGGAQTLPDQVGQGALRFTNGYPYGHNQSGAIISAMPFPSNQGIALSFKSVTYRGDSGGAGADGADGLSFFLMDGSVPPNLGAPGGSLGYSCSMRSSPYNGITGGYVVVGVDEYGNFLNGALLMPGYTGSNTASGDNSQYGYGYKPNRIGMRGTGSVNWTWLNQNYPAYYPSTFTPAQQTNAVINTCQSGAVWNTSTGSPALDSSGNPMAIPDYAPIPGAYIELPASVLIANEGAMSRQGATPISYQLKITPNGLLSFSYSYNGGAFQQVITNQSISVSNGPVPATFAFGFSASSGSHTNIHEILCFKAVPETAAASSAGASQQQSSKLAAGVQAYFAFYNPADWTGRVTASALGLDSFGNVVVAPTPTWDAACSLTGVPAGSSCATTGVVGPIAALTPHNRVILTWDGNSTGIPFEFGSLTSSQQSAIDAGDTPPYNGNRVRYLRGERTNELNTSGVGLFRARDSVLADIVDSSPTFVGPPAAPYQATWNDRLYPTATNAENASTSQTYPQYVTAQQQRTNVVYIGADDGLVHGFRTGSFDANNNFIPTLNDGREVLAYMPGAIVPTIHSTTAALDYANPQYAHAFFVDAAPAAGDVFWGGQWHTWLVGGLGPGGAAIYALDVTNPTATNFTESNAPNLVIGEWSAATINCTNATACGNNMGQTYGTPQLRRLHDGNWAVIFGNGYGSASGDAGIYVMTIDVNSAAQTFYYLSTGTGSAASPNGIAYATAVDLDGDHITDYVYAGDLQGNVWRFDLTSNDESNWAVSPGPVFTTAPGQPITTQIVVASGSPSPGMQPQLMLLFGTGQKVPISTTSPTTYASAMQSLYGVWDWNLSGWNSQGTVLYASLDPASTGVAAPYTLGPANLQQQIVTINTATLDREIASNATVCWAGHSFCAVNNQFGWFLNLPGPQEQVVFSPGLAAQAFTVNTIVPAQNNPVSCQNFTDTGFTYAVMAMSGGAFTQVFLPPDEAENVLLNTNPRYTDAEAIALQTNATGSSYIIDNSAGTPYLVYETIGGSGAPQVGSTLGVNLPPNTLGRRLTWIQRR